MFEDRVHAGRRLGAALRETVDEDERPVVLGLPRGGVIVAREVASALGAPLDVVVVRKVGAPSNPEYAVGALAEDGVVVSDERGRGLLRMSEADWEAAVAREAAELDRRVDDYRKGRPPIDVAGRLVIVVDDGLATGATALAACRSVRNRGPARVVLAVPVAAAQWRDSEVADEADELVALEEPPDLGAVGRYYEDFAQTTDEQVIEALARLRAVENS